LRDRVTVSVDIGINSINQQHPHTAPKHKGIEPNVKLWVLRTTNARDALMWARWGSWWAVVAAVHRGAMVTRQAVVRWCNDERVHRCNDERVHRCNDERVHRVQWLTQLTGATGASNKRKNIAQLHQKSK
jgi:hypothetical protein